MQFLKPKTLRLLIHYTFKHCCLLYEFQFVEQLITEHDLISLSYFSNSQQDNDRHVIFMFPGGISVTK